MRELCVARMKQRPLVWKVYLTFPFLSGDVVSAVIYAPGKDRLKFAPFVRLVRKDLKGLYRNLRLILFFKYREIPIFI